VWKLSQSINLFAGSLRQPIGPSRGERLSGTLCVAGRVGEVAHGGAAAWFNSERPENMLGVEDGMHRPADVDRRHVWLLLATAISGLSRIEQW
jgi:hypothetical protein